MILLNFIMTAIGGHIYKIIKSINYSIIIFNSEDLESLLMNKIKFISNSAINFDFIQNNYLKNTDTGSGNDITEFNINITKYYDLYSC